MEKITILIIVVAIIAIIVLLYFLTKPKNPKPIPPSPSNPPSPIPAPTPPAPVTDFTFYSEQNFKGDSVKIPGPGSYPVKKECTNSALPLLPFIPRSAKIPPGYKIGFKGGYGGLPDTPCGPNLYWVENNFNTLGSTLTSLIFTNYTGSIEVAQI